MATFIALYTGQTVGDARLIALTLDAQLVSHVAEKLLQDTPRNHASDDPITHAMQQGREQALRIIAGHVGSSRTTNQNEEGE